MAMNADYNVITHIIAEFFYKLPAFGKMRHIERALVMFSVAGAVLTGAGYTHLEKFIKSRLNNKTDIPEKIVFFVLSSLIIIEAVYSYGFPSYTDVIKPRDIPPYFGWEAKTEAELYAKVMAVQLQEFFKLTDLVNEVIKQVNTLQKTERYEITSTPDGKLHRIELTVKDSEKPKKRHRRSKEEDTRKEENLPDNIIIWLNADYQITHIEILGDKEKIVGVLMPVKYNKMWNVGQLDITVYKVTWPEKSVAPDDTGETVPPPLCAFKERNKMAFTYAHPIEKVMVISNLQITRLDKDGKTLVRRNEPNPVNIMFTKHEVEKSK